MDLLVQTNGGDTVIVDTSKWTGKFPRTKGGYHAVRCPVVDCGSGRIETQCLNATDEHDPNRKFCHACGYTWRQVYDLVAS